ncbi:lipase, putative [Trypanosoma brucei brucei TREU927]|uniref:Lipase, putative n=1 Tax=Trypanosoma brucei brucei (strain 927/4 GUTat10.1) TaxID=185431 RepID=Q57WC2_TRYB2|nr:lipase, putative [Trypanosoma brucei brucei TREU927]AAX70110.1 lipase, putative [Trypanosoma brucei]AAZ10419.1 lipase, putative [Trypanosoma brucei brucei TREU927]
MMVCLTIFLDISFRICLPVFNAHYSKRRKGGSGMPIPTVTMGPDPISEPLLHDADRDEIPFCVARNIGREMRRGSSSDSGNRWRQVEPVLELQIETLSTTSAGWFLNSWYGALVVALVLQSLVSFQWGMVNICDSSSVSIRNLDSWRSSCVERYEYQSADLNCSGTKVLVQACDPPPHSSHRAMLPSLLGCGAVPLSAPSYAEDSPGPNHDGMSMRSGGYIPKQQQQRLFNLRWVDRNVIDIPASKANRFPRVVFSLASPQDAISGDIPFKTYQLQVVLEKFPVHAPSEGDINVNSGTSRPATTGVYRYNTTTTCFRTTPRCSSVVLPQDVVVVGGNSRITLTIIGAVEELASVASMSSVGIAFQRSFYTIFTIACRYTLIVISGVHLIFFLYRIRRTQTIYEHYWVTALNVALILYLDPFFAAGVDDENGVELYRFFEYHMPNYFIAFLNCFIFALVGASINASGEVGETKRRLKGETVPGCDAPVLEEPSPRPGRPLATVPPDMPPSSPGGDPRDLQRKEKNSWTSEAHDSSVLLASPDGDRAALVRRRGMPLWVTVSITYYFVILVGLDVGRAFVENWDWGTVADCATFCCRYLASMFYTMLLLLVFASNVLLLWLKRNLGRQPYLETRPRQLACRVFIFVFASAMVYFVVQAVLIDLLYPHIVRIVVYQPFSQLAPVMVSSCFVSHITFVYTPTTASRRVPIRPNNPMWRRVVWSRQWYQWLQFHGGILYIFHNEEQERYFNFLQNKQRLAKVLHRRSGRVPVATEHEGVGPICSTAECVWNGDGPLGTYDAESSDSSDSSGGESSFSYNSSHNEDDDVASSGRGSRRRNWSRIRRGVSTLFERAECRFVEKSALLLDSLEGAILDPLQSLQLGGNRRVPFFNLEAAIDCLNLSWEAYAPLCSDVDASRRDADGGGNGTSSYCADCTPCAFPPETRGEGDSDKSTLDERAFLEGAVDSSAVTTVDNRPIDGDLQSFTVAREGSSTSVGPAMCTKQYGYKPIAVFEALDVVAVCAVMDTEFLHHRGKVPRIVIAFRGTANMSNARENIRVRQRPWREVDGVRQWWGLTKRARVHSGFLNIWISLKPAVLHTLHRFLKENSSTVYRVFCTGHSMGGAVACLCAYSVRRMLREIEYPLDEVTVYTFGQPPMGNAAFQTAYDKAIPRTFRVVNESDAVSLFSLFGGTHVGTEVDIDRHGNYICKPMFIEMLFRPTGGKGFALKNHTLAAYAQSLNAVADRNSGRECKVRCLQPYVRDVVDPSLSALSSAAANVSVEHQAANV